MQKLSRTNTTMLVICENREVNRRAHGAGLKLLYSSVAAACIRLLLTASRHLPTVRSVTWLTSVIYGSLPPPSCLIILSMHGKCPTLHVATTLAVFGILISTQLAFFNSTKLFLWITKSSNENCPPPHSHY